MLALAVAYEIQCRFTAAVPMMSKGFNHATQLAISAALGAGKLFGLSAAKCPMRSRSQPSITSHSHVCTLNRCHSGKASRRE
jgi:hypothetical protein